jgi:hypothetical protein
MVEMEIKKPRWQLRSLRWLPWLPAFAGMQE